MRLCAALLVLVSAGFLSGADVSARPGPNGLDVYVVGVDGSGLRNLTQNRESDAPVVSPNGRKVAYVRGAPPAVDIWEMNADGSGQTQRTGATTSEREPAWGPDGKAFAFTYGQPGSRVTSIRVLNWTGADVRRPGAHPRFSPTGRALAFQDASGIATLSRSGARYRRLMPGGKPVWSPDGRRIAFERAGFIAVMNADGSARLRRLARGRDASWSKRGLIAFVRAGDVFVVRPDGRGLRRLTSGAALDSVPAWSRDGTKLAFVRQVGQDPRHLYVVAANGSGLSAVSRQTAGVSAARPAWSPDGRRLYFAAILPILPR
jgi:Tol biopolymer transport system component